jgi:hypothetical protein
MIQWPTLACHIRPRQPGLHHVGRATPGFSVINPEAIVWRKTGANAGTTSQVLQTSAASFVSSSHIASVIAYMSKINSLFEHEAAMRRQVENSTHQPTNLPNQTFERQTGPAESLGSTANTVKPTRHRASVACASCRDRRIRVSISVFLLCLQG